MKKIAFVFVAAIAASFAVSFSSCNGGAQTADTTATDSVVEEVCDSAACCDSVATDTTAADSTVVPEA